MTCGCASAPLLSPGLAWAAQSCAAQTSESQAAITPQEALQLLKDGNARFAEGRMRNCDFMEQVRSTGASQHPFAAIVGCIDSRESATTTFDQGIGDVFGARIAGNFVNDDMLGSLEFACAASGAKLILVVGHTECGAVKGAIDDVVLGNLTQTLVNLRPAVAETEGYDEDRSSNNPDFVLAVTERNVEMTIDRILSRSPLLNEMEGRGEIMVAGSVYDVHTGWVRFLS